LKKPIAPVLLTVLALAVATPAQAAVPKGRHDMTVHCANGKTGRVSYTLTPKGLTRLAADNPCADWIVIWLQFQVSGAANDGAVGVESGVHFNHVFKSPWPRYDAISAREASAPPDCVSSGNNWVVHRGTHGRFDRGPNCP
jgi:hypothetical protein